MAPHAPSDDPVVLVVDDEPGLADLFATWLADEWDVRVAYDGETSLETMDEAVAVVVLDRRLPDIPGDEVLDAIREAGYDCRVIMVTAIEPDFDIIEMGVDEYLVKPVANDDLLETVERVHRRGEYDEILDEYYGLAAKRAVLSVEKSSQELDDSPEFEDLETRLGRLRDSIDETVGDLDGHADFAAAFRDLDGDQD